MKDSVQVIAFFAFEHFKNLIKSITAVNIYSQSVFFCKLNLVLKSILLFCKAGFIPIKVYTYFAHGSELSRSQLRFYMCKFFEVIFFYIGRMQPHHEKY